MIATSLTKKGQVTIPREIREALGLKEHDKVIFAIKDGEVMMRPIRGTIIDLRGTVTPRKRPSDFDTIRNEVKRSRSKEIAEDMKDG